MAETQHTLTHGTEFLIGFGVSLLPALTELLFAVLSQNVGAAGKDALRGSLHHQQVALSVFTFVNRKLELVGTVEGDLGNLGECITVFVDITNLE